MNARPLARDYRGITLWPASPNSSGIRWHCFTPRGPRRADTLAGIKAAVRDAMTTSDAQSVADAEFMQAKP